MEKGFTPAPIDGEAEYMLESTLQCPFCKNEMTSVQVVRMLRGRVNFTSSLPRRGYVIICPHCKSILSAELTGMV